MASITTRTEAANKYMANGHKFLKTSMLKWKPDHDNAANQFVQAAMCFRGAGLHQKAIEANELAIESYIACGSNGFQAAKCLEQCALSCKELGDFKRLSRYYLRAVDLYKESGFLDSAITVAERAAKILKNEQPTMAAEFYTQASEFCAIEDRYRQAAEFCTNATLLYVKVKDFDRAASIGREKLNCLLDSQDAGRDEAAFGMILVNIANKNIVGAREAAEMCSCDPSNYNLARNLVKAFETKDAKSIDSILNNNYFKHMDSEFARLALDLKATYGEKAVVGKPEEEQIKEDEAALL